MWGFWQKKKDGPGLNLKFKVGEQLPWKGIFFTVEKVMHDKILLSPAGLTWKMAKRIQAAKGEANAS